jgi:hypothetical protein
VGGDKGEGLFQYFVHPHPNPLPSRERDNIFNLLPSRERIISSLQPKQMAESQKGH